MWKLGTRPRSLISVNKSIGSCLQCASTSDAVFCMWHAENSNPTPIMVCETAAVLILLTSQSNSQAVLIWCNGPLRSTHRTVKNISGFPDSSRDVTANFFYSVRKIATYSISADPMRKEGKENEGIKESVYVNNCGNAIKTLWECLLKISYEVFVRVKLGTQMRIIILCYSRILL